MVVIVDDDELIRGSLGGLMKEAGFSALTFASAEEYITSGEEKRTACLIVDIRMPGMSGLGLQAKLNEAHQGVPIIFITAQGDEKLRLQALRAGAVEFLTKPFNENALLDCVRAAALETGRGFDQHRFEHIIGNSVRAISSTGKVN